MTLSLQKKVVLGLQHTIAMFGATVLVPLLTGLNPSVALFGAGAATLLFHVLTGLGVPIFLGSSFAFIAPIIAVMKSEGPAATSAGLVAAGAMYLVFSALVKVVGVARVKRVFPPIVTGPVIIVIGLSLSGVAIELARHGAGGPGGHPRQRPAARRPGPARAGRDSARVARAGGATRPRRCRWRRGRRPRAGRSPRAPGAWARCPPPGCR